MNAKKIMFVCTGNTCRSPMAQGIFQALLSKAGLEAECGSAGLAAVPGSPASAHAAQACRELGIDLSGHRSRPLTQEDLPGTDLFAVMTASHFRALEQAGVPAEKIRVLGVADPFGGSLEDYRACRDALAQRLELLIQEEFGHE